METPRQFSSPQEELDYLRAQVAQREAALAAHERTPEARTQIIAEQVTAHHEAPATVLAPQHAMPKEAVRSAAADIIAELDLGDTEAVVRSLVQTLDTQGAKNALAVADRLGNPQAFDDFHRYLVRRIASGMDTTGIDERAPRFQALKMTLYEIALPAPKDTEQSRAKPLKELVSGMEQFYAGMLSVEEATQGEPNYFALELAIPANKPELQFYAAVPNSKRSLFEKQVVGIFPDAHIEQQPYDYNIFVDGGTSYSAVAKLADYAALPIKDYTEFDIDPLNAITSAFSKIEHMDEGAALQTIIEPRGGRHTKHFAKILAELRKGVKKNEAFKTPETLMGEFAHDIGKMLFSSTPKDTEKAKESEQREIEANKISIEQVERKIASPIVGVTIRVATSSKDPEKARQTLTELESVFNQFSNTLGNRIEFKQTDAKHAQSVLDDFSFRLPDEGMPLSLRELTTLYHFPSAGLEGTPHLKQARFTHAPAPLTLPQTGVLIGTNEYRGRTTNVHLDLQDRLRHLYVIGQTGTGKTSLLKAMIAQDIKNGEGCCFIDPHGTDILDILGCVPPERYNDVIYFDPADLSRPFGLNFLEYDITRPEQKTFIVNELLMIFRRLYGDVPESMGPAFEQYFRNATQLVMEDPSSGSTILDIVRVLANKEFRDLKLSRSMNPIVNQFWTDIATKAEGEASLQNIVPWITNKFDDFTANDYIRPIVGQQQSSFKFRDIMDNKKILLVNLSKGRLGEKNANIIGLILVGKIFMAALSRADSPGVDLPPFYLYIDEFQNITTDSIPGILSEARKYKLSLNIAHQFLKQIEERTRDAVFGNVGNMAVYRVGEEDAEFFAKQFAPTFTALDFVNIENYNAYVRILASGVPQPPFDMHSAPLPVPNKDQIADLIQLSALTYGRDRATVENVIRERYLTK